MIARGRSVTRRIAASVAVVALAAGWSVAVALASGDALPRGTERPVLAIRATPLGGNGPGFETTIRAAQVAGPPSEVLISCAGAPRGLEARATAGGRVIFVGPLADLRNLRIGRLARGGRAEISLRIERPRSVVRLRWTATAVAD
jgi:hypothetical protein